MLDGHGPLVAPGISMTLVLRNDQDGRAPAEANRFATGAAFADDRFIPVSEASISILDWGFLHSDATYDVAHVWNGAFFRLDEHLDRFEHSMARLRMRIPFDRGQIREILGECVRLAGLDNAYVEMLCTRGVPRPGSRDPRDAANRFYAFAIPFVWIATPEKQDEGLDLTIAATRRIAPEAVDPTVKNYHWLDLVAGLFEAYDRGGETAALVDGAGHVLEGPGFNVFALVEGRLVTPRAGVLQGITRRTALEIARELGLDVEERPLRADELRSADEAFITSTAGGIIPVTRVDGKALGNGHPGLKTTAIRGRYWQLHADPRFATPVASLGAPRLR